MSSLGIKASLPNPDPYELLEEKYERYVFSNDIYKHYSDFFFPLFIVTCSLHKLIVLRRKASLSLLYT